MIVTQDSNRKVQGRESKDVYTRRNQTQKHIFKIMFSACVVDMCSDGQLTSESGDKDDYKKWKDFGRLIPNGVDVRWLSSRGPLHRLQSAIFWVGVGWF